MQCPRSNISGSPWFDTSMSRDLILWNKVPGSMPSSSAAAVFGFPMLLLKRYDVRMEKARRRSSVVRTTWAFRKTERFS